MEIRTEPTLDGSTYVVTLAMDDDQSMTLTPTVALEHAAVVIAAAADADYDCAVFRQVTERLNLAKDVAASLVIDLRQDRPRREAPSGLLFRGDVADKGSDGLRPFVVIIDAEDGTVLGQMSATDARWHATGVIEAVSVADLDSGFYRVLRSLIHVEDAVARNVVADVGNWRVDP